MIQMFKTMIEEMKLRNFSPQTQKVYLQYNQSFLNFARKSPRDVSGQDIRSYLLHLIEKQYSSSSINLAHNALNFYYGKLLRKNVKEVPFQKREEKHRLVPSKDEIENLCTVIKNPKYQLMISLLYASGVRVSELVRIKLQDIDVERKLLRVRQGKGGKDRYTILSVRVIEQIKAYLQMRPYPSNYLFSSRDGHLTIRAVEEVLKSAARRAKIQRATPHSLRHSFATHLMESHVRDSVIQKLLGHKDIKTTQIYASVATKHLQEIKSPHD